MGIEREQIIPNAKVEESCECFDDDGDLRVSKKSRINRHGESSSAKGKEKMEENKIGIGENGDDLKDPLGILGSDIMLRIMERLDAHSLSLSQLVSNGWRVVASDDKIWSSKCAELWIGKAHIPRIAKLHGLSKLTSYNLSVKDGKRTRITKDDLVDHDWEFHFTEDAPDYWRNLDPFWTGEGPLMRRYFHADGTLTAGEGDKVWGGHESYYSVITSFYGDGRIRENYVRVNRWPPMSITRNPDWSWELMNRIYVYTSIADAQKEAGTGPLFYAF